jgi:cysteinyl-tRNA synthetase
MTPLTISIIEQLRSINRQETGDNIREIVREANEAEKKKFFNMADDLRGRIAGLLWADAARNDAEYRRRLKLIAVISTQTLDDQSVSR